MAITPYTTTLPSSDAGHVSYNGVTYAKSTGVAALLVTSEIEGQSSRAFCGFVLGGVIPPTATIVSAVLGWTWSVADDGNPAGVYYAASPSHTAETIYTTMTTPIVDSWDSSAGGVLEENLNAAGLNALGVAIALSQAYFGVGWRQIPASGSSDYSVLAPLELSIVWLPAMAPSRRTRGLYVGGFTP